MNASLWLSVPSILPVRSCPEHHQVQKQDGRAYGVRVAAGWGAALGRSGVLRAKHAGGAVPERERPQEGGGEPGAAVPGAHLHHAQLPASPPGMLRKAAMLLTPMI